MLALPRIRLTLPVSDASCQARPLARQLRRRQGDTMNAFTAADQEAADLLALARLDDDGAPCPSGLPRSQPGRPGPDNDRGRGSAAAADAPAGGQRRARRGRFSRPAPAGACHRGRTIAAAPGRARRQLTPALTGAG